MPQSFYQAGHSLPPDKSHCITFMDRLLRETRTLISCGGFQFAHLAEALKIKSMNLRADSGAMIAEAYGSIRGS